MQLANPNHILVACVIGGPNQIGSNQGWEVTLWTVLTEEGKTEVWSTNGGYIGRRGMERVRDSLISQKAIEDVRYHLNGRKDNGAVIYKYCCSCEEEMIFYSDDFICAWCREKFEDKYDLVSYKYDLVS